MIKCSKCEKWVDISKPVEKEKGKTHSYFGKYTCPHCDNKIVYDKIQ